MAHPLMFDAGDPLLARLRGIALAMPGAAEKVSHGRPAFFTTKVFAYYGGTTKQEHRDGLHPPRLSVRRDASSPNSTRAPPRRSGATRRARRSDVAGGSQARRVRAAGDIAA